MKVVGEQIRISDTANRPFGIAPRRRPASVRARPRRGARVRQAGEPPAVLRGGGAVPGGAPRGTLRAGRIGERVGRPGRAARRGELAGPAPGLAPGATVWSAAPLAR